VAGPPKRAQILVVNQYYWPGVEATAHLLTELAEDLARELDVTVVTSVLHRHEDLPRRERRNGVEIVRVPSTSFERSLLTRRALNYATFMGSALAHAVSDTAPDLVLCMTDPPMVGDVALAVARRFRVPLLVVSEDVFPEIAVELKRLENPILVHALRRLVRLYLRRADGIVAIGETMRKRLIDKGAPPERIRVIPNWVDTTALTPQPRDNEWARENGLVGRFVVMHSGNVGHAQSLDTLVRAATFLRDLDDLEIVIAGFGARHASIVRLAGRLEAPVRFLPYQPRELLAQSLSSADVHFVGLAPGLAGYVVPSRLYGILAVARPVLVSADADSEISEIVRTMDCGVVLPPGRPELVAGAIRDLYERRAELPDLGARGRTYVEQEADRAVAHTRYRVLIDELLSRQSATAA
jgi:glycosyltransferase involved in cell wall biosynthesis